MKIDKSELILMISKNLCEANKNKNFDEVIKIGKQLAPLLSEAYFSAPELFASVYVKKANKIVQQLIKANYISIRQNRSGYVGGSPGLGKKS